MKPLIALPILLVAASMGWAQGEVTFRNALSFLTPDPTGGNQLVYDIGSPLNPLTGVGLSGNQYIAELYAGGDAGSFVPVTGSITRFHTTTTTSQGR